MTVTLDVEKRDIKKKAKALRAAGVLPGVVYGPKQEALPVALNKKQFEKVFAAAGESTVIELEGLGAVVSVLVKEVEFSPTRGGIQHVDFYAIEMGKKITAMIQLEFIGEAPATKQGGVLNRVLHEIEVTCMPSDLPPHIDVDLGVLNNIGDQLHVSDLVIGKGVEVETGADEMVVLVGEPVEEEVDVPVAVDMDAIEVEKKGKTEEESKE